MNVFELLGTIAINNKGANKSIDETTGKAKNLSSRMGQAFTSIGKGAVSCGKFVAKGLTVVGAAGATAALAMTKASIDAYAEFEQLQGGVKKLFGDDVAKTVMANANKAFKTAGLSANEYMEQATSFSASLISGLGGDTAAAAEMADMAITDMADNANTFGTDISAIQNAYQGFAKQNYTMLDNLKLGYGGTQEEMARLINDSGVMGDTFQATAENVKDISFAKIIEAIHVVQKEMNIAGTTSAEATDTIAGSFNMWKATWTNLMTGMAGDENIEPLVDAFFEAGQSVLANIGKVLPKIGTNIVKTLQLAGQKIKTVWANNIWPIIQNFFKTTFGIELPDWDTLVQTISDGWENDVWPRIQGFFKTVFGIELPAWSDIGSSIKTMWNNLKSTISGWFSKTFEVNTDDTTGFTTGQKIREWWDSVVIWVGDRFNAVFEVKPEDAKKAGERVRAWWDGVVAWFGDLFKGLFSVEPEDESGQSTVQNIRNWWHHVANLIKNFFAGLFGVELEDPEGSLTAKLIENWWWGLWDDIAEFFKIHFDIELPDSETAKKAFVDWWNGFVTDLGLPFFKIIEEEGLSEAPLSSYSKEDQDKLQAFIDAENVRRRKVYEGEGTLSLMGASVTAGAKAIQLDHGLINAYEQALQKHYGTDNPQYFPPVSQLLVLSEGSEATVQEDLDGMELETEVSVGAASGAESALQTELNGYSLTVKVGTELDRDTEEKIKFMMLNGMDGYTTDGSHASGLRYVPYDGYVSELHLGEAVLPRNEAEEYRSGKGGSSNTSALETALNSLISLTQQLVSNTASGNNVYLDTGVLVGQLTPSIDSRLGTLTARKERRG